MLPALALALAFGPATVSLAASPGVTASLRPSYRYYYEGDTVTVGLVMRNAGEATLRTPPRPAANIEIRGADGRPRAAGAATERANGSRPSHLEPGSTYETVIDLGGVEGLQKAGTYELRWRSGEYASDAVEVTVLPRYDASQPYTAHVETDLGSIVIQLLPKVSPLAVKAFVDLARAGFYDGSRFHEIRADSYVAAGEPKVGGPESSALAFPAEQSDLVVGPGTVVLKPVGPAPPANGSGFIISLEPRPAWRGQVTVLGQVVLGLDVVQRISRVPLRTTGARPGGRPADEVGIVRVTITAEAPAEAGS